MRLIWVIFKQCAIFSTKQSLAWICTCQIDDQSKLHFNDRWSYSPFITKREEQLASPILVPNTEKKPSCNNVRDMSSNTNGLIEVLDRREDWKNRMISTHLKRLSVAQNWNNETDVLFGWTKTKNGRKSREK